MARPQKEDGYTAIANEILEAIARVKLSPTQYRLLFIIWRYTYGFQRKEANLSLTFLSSATGCDKRQIQREIKELVDRNIISQCLDKCHTRTISFNKDYESWLPIGEIDNGSLTNGEIDNGQTSDTAIGQTVNPLLVKQTTKKENSKENIKEIIIMLAPDEVQFLDVLKTIPSYPFDRAADLQMYQRLKERYPPLDHLEAIKDWREYKADNPLKPKDNPRSQINTSFKNSMKWGKNLKTGGKSNGVDKEHTDEGDWEERYFAPSVAGAGTQNV